MKRNNCICDYCNKAFYKKPNQILKCKKHYCSINCYNSSRELKTNNCLTCGKVFTLKTKTQRYCSKSCATKESRKGWSTQNKNKWVAPNYKLLLDTFGITNCMIEGCNYSKTLDIHRYKAGKYGGKYEIGNMFFVCPNHHAEIHRHIINVIKVNDYCLSIRD